MDSSTSEFSDSRIDSNMSKFLRYNKNTSVSYSSIRLKDDILSQDNDKPLQQQNSSSSCNLKSNPHLPSNNDDLTPKVPQDLLSLYTTTANIKLPSSFPTEKLKLSILDLSSSTLNEFPQEIISLDSLKLLRLDNNFIPEIPINISKLTQLESFSLSYNLIKVVPASISRLSSLKELSLEHNLLENLGDEISGLTNLRILNIYHNLLFVLPTCIKDFSHLKEFHFEWFHYAKPQLPIIQKGQEGKPYIDKLRAKLKELHAKKMKGFSFRYFVESFSTEKVSLMDVDFQGRTLLHHACLNEDLSVVKFLTLNNPELNNITDKEDLTPFALSILKDKPRSYSLLQTKNIDIALGGGKFGSPLHIASKKLNLKLVKEVIDAGVDVNKIDSVGNIPLHYAVSAMALNFEAAAPIVQHLLDFDSNCNAKNKENWTPLHLIARKGAIKPLEWILSYNNEVKEVCGGGHTFNLDKKGGAFKWTALHIAAYTGSYKMVELLGQAGANFFKVSSHGVTPKSMLRRDGLTLNLIVKYEKEYIKRKLFTKKKILQHNPMFLNSVQSPVQKKNISFASKNKFNVSKLNLDVSKSAILPKLPLSYVGNIDTSIMRGSKCLSKRQFSDSQDIFPETDGRYVGTYEEKRIAEMGVLDNLCIAESPNNLYNCMSPSLNAPQGQVRKASQAFQNQSMKEKNSLNTYITTNIHIEDYERKLKYERNPTMEYYRKEMAYLVDNLTSHKVQFAEKTKIFVAIRILYKVVIEFLFKEFQISVSRESLPFVIYEKKMSDNPNFQTHHFRKDHIPKIVAAYDMVPEGLMGVFNLILSDHPNDNFIKQSICRILGDIRYFPAIGFFEQMVKENKEGMLVIIEAKRTILSLNSALQAHQPEKTHQELLKKQFGRTLGPRLGFGAKTSLPKYQNSNVSS